MQKENEYIKQATSSFQNIIESLTKNELDMLILQMNDLSINYVYPSSKDIKKEALKNTLNKYDFTYTYSQIKVFYKLIEFDKIDITNDIKIFCKLSTHFFN